jgi:hypothetical protein
VFIGKRVVAAGVITLSAALAHEAYHCVLIATQPEGAVPSRARRSTESEERECLAYHLRVAALLGADEALLAQMQSMLQKRWWEGSW